MIACRLEGRRIGRAGVPARERWMRRGVEPSRQPVGARPGGIPIPPHPAASPEDDFDWAFLGLWALFVVHAIKRHKVALAAMWFGVVGLSLALVVVLPKTYEVQTTLQAQRAPTISALGAGGPSAADIDAPAKQAAETVLRHENLVALVRQTDLIHNWRKNRAPLLRLKDALWARLFQPPSEETAVENFVGLLEQRLWVTTSEGTVTIGIRFPDPQLAYHLVEAAMLNFLEARHAVEISSIADVIFILQTRAAQARESLDEAQRELQQLREARTARLGQQRRPGTAIRLPAAVKPEIAQLVVKIAGKRRALEDLESFRRRDIDAMEARLVEMRALYSETHPLVIDTEQSLKALRQESPQVATLSRELASLAQELEERGIAPDAQLNPGLATEMSLRTDPLDPREDQDPDIDHAKSQVRHAVDRYNAILDRVQSAQLEQDVAQAAFKYRYVVIWPAQRPRGSVQPDPALVLLASLVAGLLLAIIGVTLLDVWPRRILETWQVERSVGVRLLGEVRLP